MKYASVEWDGRTEAGDLAAAHQEVVVIDTVAFRLLKGFVLQRNRQEKSALLLSTTQKGSLDS